MGTTTITLTGLFMEGLLSFFSPCILPLIPLYIGYLTAGYDSSDPKHRLRTFLNTFAFVLGICTVFIAAGLGSTALQKFFQTYTIQFQLIGGFLLIVLGLMTLGIVHIPLLERDYRFSFSTSGKTSFLKAYVMGFCFSFAWSPCIGPLLASAIVQAASAPTKLVGLLYLGAYSLGFILPFLIVGLFADTVLNWIKNHKTVVKYTGWLGGAVVTGVGIYMLVQANTNILALQKSTAAPSVAVSGAENNAAVIQEGAQDTPDPDTRPDAEKYNFTLNDSEGNPHSLTDYVGKPLLLNFFGTWCSYCNMELPSLQKVADNGEIEVVLIAAPHLNNEGDIAYVEQYMKDAGYHFTILYDENYDVTRSYGISGYPTTFAMNKDGSFLGYMPGYMPDEVLDQVVAQLTEKK